MTAQFIRAKLNGMFIAPFESAWQLYLHTFGAPDALNGGLGGSSFSSSSTARNPTVRAPGAQARKIGGAVLVVLFVFLGGCSDSRDARTATTGDLLFHPARFKEANDEKREALRRLRGDQADIGNQNAQLTDQVNSSTEKLKQRHARLDELDKNISDLDRKIAALSAKESESREFAKAKLQELEAIKARWKQLSINATQEKDQERIDELERSISTLKRAILAREAGNANAEGR